MKLIVLSDGRSIFKQVVSGICYTLFLIVVSFVAIIVAGFGFLMFFYFKDHGFGEVLRQLLNAFLLIAGIITIGFIYDWSKRI